MLTKRIIRNRISSIALIPYLFCCKRNCASSELKLVRHTNETRD